MKVLVVDDNVDIAESFGLILEFHGHTIALAHDGIEACKRASEWLPEAAILDIRLPGKHGYEVATFLRSLNCLKPGCLIAMTGDGGPDGARRAKEAGFDHLLLKPTSAEHVAGLLTLHGGAEA